MIGIEHTSRSFRQDINYCLNDKLTQAIENGERQIAYEQRAEIVHWNRCYGTAPELIRQFKEVADLNHNICEPYLDLVFGLPPQDGLTSSQWAEVAVKCSTALGFGDHQFIAIRHHDTAHQHIHLLANRIGFAGDVVRDRYLLQKVNNFCLQTEIDYGLTRTLGLRCFLPKELRDTPRDDERLHRLQETIAASLETACTFSAFEQDMREHGYDVYRSERGIAFREEKGVIFRGSEADHPWKKIEQVLEQNELRQKQELEEQHRLAHRHSLHL